MMPVKPGSIGRALPGHTCAIVDDEGRELADGETGHIAVKAPHPVMFLGYLNRADATREKYVGDWLLSGDTGLRDADGYYRFREYRFYVEAQAPDRRFGLNSADRQDNRPIR